jgi:hypothetical protein
MKRDMELIRELLLAIEAKKDPFYQSTELEINSERSLEEVNYNLQLLTDANLVKADIESTFDSPIPDVFIRRMTWEGHEFLDKARDESIWSTAKETIMKKGLSLESVGFGALTQVLASAVKQILSLS